MSAVQARGIRSKPYGGGVKIACPACGEQDPSCSVKYWPEKGKTTLKCFASAGCSDVDILDRLGLSVADLYDDPKPPSEGPKQPSNRSTNGLVEFSDAPSKEDRPAPKQAPKTTGDKAASKRLAAEYFYPLPDGSQHGKVLRWELLDEHGQMVSKTFTQRRFNTDTRRWQNGGFDKILYNAPKVAQAIAAGDTVYVSEGEKDADSLDDAGVVATTNAGGAGGFSAEHAEHLRGAHVVLVVDHDLAGYKRAVTISDLLFPADGEPLVAALRIVRGKLDAAKSDVTDHLDAGHSVDELVDVDAARMVAELELAIAREKLADPDQHHTAQRCLDNARAMLERAEGDTAKLAAEHARLTAELGTVDELARKRQQRQSNNSDEDTADGGPRTGGMQSIPMSSGHWAFSQGDGSRPRGVYRGVVDDGHIYWTQVAPLPYVLERMQRLDGQGRSTGMSYRLAMRGPVDTADRVITVTDFEVKTGEWAERLDVAMSADDKVGKAVATAIRLIAADAPRRAMVPQWNDGRLAMPAADVIGGGYGEIRGHEDTARTIWQQIAAVAARNPKVALTLGMAWAGLYVAPLKARENVPVRSAWMQLVGHGQKGKTTTQELSAGLFGDPGVIKETFDGSEKGVMYRLSELAVLPLFLDELGAGELKDPAKRERMILSVAEGARRRTATRDQRTKMTSPWYGTVICSGNDPLTEDIANEAVHARVIELPAPITETIAEWECLNELLLGLPYGWPLRWWQQDTVDFDWFERTYTEGIATLGVEGGVAGTGSRCLALAMAGAADLDRILGTDCLQQAAQQAAHGSLAQLLDELEDHGLTPSDRLINAVIDANAAMPGVFPTRETYALACRQAAGNIDPDAPMAARVQLPRELYGWDISGDDIDGDIALTKDGLKAIAQAAGLPGIRIALRELDEAKILLRSTEQGKKRLQRDLQVHADSGRRKVRVYVFRLGEDTLRALHEGAAPNTPDDGSDTASLESPQQVGTGSQSGDDSKQSLTRDDEAPVPAVPTFPTPARQVIARARGKEREEAAAAVGHQLGDGPNGPIWSHRKNRYGHCRYCGAQSRHYDLQGWGCWQCILDADDAVPTEEPADPHDEPAHAEPTTAVTVDRVELDGPIPQRPTGWRASCAVFDTSGIYLPDGERQSGHQVTDALDVLNLGDQLRIGHPGGLGQLILMDSMCADLGLIAEADDDAVGNDERTQVRTRLDKLGEKFLARARDHGWQIQRRGDGDDAEISGLRVETRCYRPDDGRAFSLVLAPYEWVWSSGREDAHPVGTLDENLTAEQAAAETARLMGHLAELLGVPWRSTASQVGWDMFDRAQKKATRHKVTQPAPLPTLTGGVDAADLMPLLSWSRWTRSNPASAGDRDLIDQARYAVHLDRKAAWLGSAAQTKLGYLPDGEQMQHLVGADAVGDVLERGPQGLPAGLMRLWVPAATDPATPPLHPEQSTERGRWLWLPTQLASQLLYADDPGANVLGWGCSAADLVTPTDDDADGHAEAHLFPAHGQMLGSKHWAGKLTEARYAIEHAYPSTHAVRKLHKAVYAAMLQVSEATSEHVLRGPRAWHHQPTWLSAIKAHHYGWQWHLMRRAVLSGLCVASVEVDEVVLLVDDPADATLGTMAGKVGQYKVKTVRKLTDQHRDKLARGIAAHSLTGGEVDQ